MAEQNLQQNLAELERNFPNYAGYDGRRIGNLSIDAAIIDGNDEALFQLEDRDRRYIRDRCRDFIHALRNVGLGYGYGSLVHNDENDERYSSVLFHSESENSNLVISANRKNMMNFSVNDIRRLCHENDIRRLCHENIYSHAWDFYYGGKLVLGWTEEQATGCLADLCCLFQCTRDSLRLSSSDDGLVVGPLTYLYDDIRQNCMVPDGLSIPRRIDLVHQFHTSAIFILVVEKENVFNRLVNNNFHHEHPCIIITGRGQGAVHTRRFLRNLQVCTGLPVFGLFDGDIHGLMTLASFAIGSMNMAYDSGHLGHLAIPNIKWLGIRSRDIKDYKIPEEALRDMTEADLEKARGWVKRDCFDRFSKGWGNEVADMIKLKKSASIQSLDWHGLDYLFHYLRKKLKEGEWI